MDPTCGTGDGADVLVPDPYLACLPGLFADTVRVTRRLLPPTIAARFSDTFDALDPANLDVRSELADRLAEACDAVDVGFRRVRGEETRERLLVAGRALYWWQLAVMSRSFPAAVVASAILLCRAGERRGDVALRLLADGWTPEDAHEQYVRRVLDTAALLA